MTKRSSLCSAKCLAMLTGALIVVAATGVTIPAAAELAAAGDAPLMAGRTVWDGVYTEQQLTQGKEYYGRECSYCHMEDLSGDGGAIPALAGAAFFERWSGATLGDVMETVTAAMPPGMPGMLPAQEYAAIIAYIMSESGIPAGSAELPDEVDELKGILVTHTQ